MRYNVQVHCGGNFICLKWSIKTRTTHRQTIFFFFKSSCDQFFFVLSAWLLSHGQLGADGLGGGFISLGCHRLTNELQELCATAWHAVGPRQEHKRQWYHRFATMVSPWGNCRINGYFLRIVTHKRIKARRMITVRDRGMYSICDFRLTYTWTAGISWIVITKYNIA